MFGKGSHVWVKVLIRPDKLILVSQAFFFAKVMRDATFYFIFYLKYLYIELCLLPEFHHSPTLDR